MLRWTLVGEWKIVCHSNSMIFFLTLRGIVPSLQTPDNLYWEPKGNQIQRTNPVQSDKRDCINHASLAGYSSLLVITLYNLHFSSFPVLAPTWCKICYSE